MKNLSVGLKETLSLKRNINEVKTLKKQRR